MWSLSVLQLLLWHLLILLLLVWSLLVLLLRRKCLLVLRHWHVLLALRSRYDHLGLSLLRLLRLLLVPMMRLHLCRRILLRVLWGLPILLEAILWLWWSIWDVRAIGIAVLLVIPWIHCSYLPCSEVRSPGIVVCHDIVRVRRVV